MEIQTILTIKLKIMIEMASLFNYYYFFYLADEL